MWATGNREAEKPTEFGHEHFIFQAASMRSGDSSDSYATPSPSLR